MISPSRRRYTVGMSDDVPPTPLTAIIHDEIGQAGPITFARYMELALYHPEHGYYLALDRRPGRAGDFLTAPELHPFFGLTIGRWLADRWDALGRPDPFTVLEYGSGIGGLAYDAMAGMLDAQPGIESALRYRLNEVNPHRQRQALDAMAEVGLSHLAAADDGEPVTGVVLANEVADAFPAHRLRWTGTVLEEIHVGWDAARGFVDVPGSLSPGLAALDPEGSLLRAGVDLATLPVDARLEIAPAAAGWMREVAARLSQGYALVIDYGYPAPELYSGHRLEGLLRVYEGHTVTDNPYRAPGEQDLTAHVDFTSLIDAGLGAGLELVGLTTQADFLAGAGLGDLLVEMQGDPDVTVESYYRAQSAVFRLIDPGGLGHFRVLGLARDAPVDPPPAGFAGPSLPHGLMPVR